MINAGDIYSADLNDEMRSLVLVVSNRRFNELSDRVLVAPEFPSVGDVRPPWRIDVDGTTFAVDRLRSLPADRLLSRVDRAPATVMAHVRRAVQHMT